MAAGTPLKIRVQILCGSEIAMGPGKADLLEAIVRTGSISAAARAMGMSYRRAWLLVDAMNRCWAQPLVETVAGGGKDRGARLSVSGERLLAAYRSLQEAVASRGEDVFLREMAADLRSRPLPPPA